MGSRTLGRWIWLRKNKSSYLLDTSPPEVDRETGTEDIGTVAKKDWNRKAKGEFPGTKDTVGQCLT